MPDRDRPFNLNVAESNVSGRRLAYTDEFKKLFLTENQEASGPKKEKHLISTVIALIDFLESPDRHEQPAAYEANGVRVEIYLPNRFTDVEEESHSSLYKITYKDKVYFLKKQGVGLNEHIYAKDGHNAFNEVINSAELASDIESQLAGLGPVRVVPYQVGYTDKNNSYFVAEYIDYPNLFDYEQSLQNSIYRLRNDINYGRSTDVEGDERRLEELESKAENLHQRWWKIHEMLNKKYIDTKSHNMLYNPATEEIVIIDVNPQKKAGKR